MKDKLQSGFYTWTTVVLILAVLIVVNILALGYFGRLDLTEGKIYSLSKASKEVVANLDDKLVVKAFFSENLPPPYNNNAKFLKDELAEYRAYSNGNFHYEFIDPGTEEKLEEEAMGYRVPPIQVNVVEKDKIELKKVFMGLVFLYEDKSETIPVVQNLTNLEYDITSTIKRITAEKLLKVGFLTGHEEPSITEDLRSVTTAMRKQYQVIPVDLSDGLNIPEDLDVLVIAGPRKEFTEWEKFCIDQFIMGGGKVAFLIDKIDTDIQTMRARKFNLKLDDWLRGYGIKINDDLVVDLHSARIPLQQARGFFTITNIVNYPFFPTVANFDRKNLIAKDLEEVNFYFVSSIDTSVARDQGLRVSVVASSSDMAGRKTRSYDINPLRQFRRNEFTEKFLPLAVSLEGEFQSYYRDKEIPDTILTKFEGEPVLEGTENRIVAVGDAEFFLDKMRFLAGASNQNFFLNIVDWLAQDEGLIAIRSREVTTRPLKEISQGAKRAVKYSNILVPPFLIIGFGLIYWRMRRRRKITLE
ncbi:Gldg family protein [candidate division KSB1 bacterium]|nr:Gldg family protein [candidate division KSB1 bacterium]